MLATLRRSNKGERVTLELRSKKISPADSISRSASAMSSQYTRAEQMSCTRFSNRVTRRLSLSTSLLLSAEPCMLGRGQDSPDRHSRRGFGSSCTAACRRHDHKFRVRTVVRKALTRLQPARNSSNSASFRGICSFFHTCRGYIPFLVRHKTNPARSSTQRPRDSGIWENSWQDTRLLNSEIFICTNELKKSTFLQQI
mgnify:CR=1 FL=1